MAQQDPPGGGQTRKGAGAPAWMPRRIRRLVGDRYIDHVAEFQVVTRGWNRVVGMPYLVHLPEKDRVLMLVYLDYHPCKAAVMFSDDHGTTWSKPALVPQAEDERCLRTNLMYLGGGLPADGRREDRAAAGHRAAALDTMTPPIKQKADG